MTSKDYVVEISPTFEEQRLDQMGLIKYTIRPKPSIVSKIQMPLAIIFGIIVVFLLYEMSSDMEVFQISEIFSRIVGDSRLSLSLVVLMICICRREEEESILAIRDIGVELESKGTWRFNRARKQFISSDEIIDLLIVEGFHGPGVIFYMAVLVKGSNDLKLVFPSLLPRRNLLEGVWKGCRMVLFKGKK